MRTLANCGASCKRRSFFYCTRAAWKSLWLLPIFYLYLCSRVTLAVLGRLEAPSSLVAREWVLRTSAPQLF
jgi:hypothetical protein